MFVAHCENMLETIFAEHKSLLFEIIQKVFTQKTKSMWKNIILANAHALLRSPHIYKLTIESVW